MDWWGNACGASTEKEDELRYQLARQLMLAEVEIIDAEHASWDSVVNGGTGVFTRKGE